MSLEIFFSQSTFSQMPRIILLPPDPVGSHEQGVIV